MSSPHTGRLGTEVGEGIDSRHFRAAFERDLVSLEQGLEDVPIADMTAEEGRVNPRLGVVVPHWTEALLDP